MKEQKSGRIIQRNVAVYRNLMITSRLMILLKNNFDIAKDNFEVESLKSHHLAARIVVVVPFPVGILRVGRVVTTTQYAAVTLQD